MDEEKPENWKVVRSSGESPSVFNHDEPISAQDLRLVLEEIVVPSLGRSTETFLDDLARHGVDLKNSNSYSLNQLRQVLEMQIGKELSLAIIKQVVGKLESRS